MSAHKSPQADRFVHDRLPAAADWPEIIPLAGVPLTGPLNCVHFLLDRHLATDTEQRPAILSGERTWSYADLADRAGRIAHMMATDLGILPGNRVLIRGANSPEVAAIWLAIQKIGAVAVTTMSLLRAGELGTILEMARPIAGFCDESLTGELETATVAFAAPFTIVSYGADAGELYRLIENRPAIFQTCPTLADDISLIAFTSGTTGRPKATVHCHRDVLAICETVSRHVLKPTADDVFIGTAPLAFTFGLGGLLVFPLEAGAATVLSGPYTPDDLIAAIARHRASVCFTVPTFFQRMLAEPDPAALQHLRLSVSSGEALPAATRKAWAEVTGLDLTEVIGSTEMLHAFAGATGPAVRDGYIGPAFPGYEVTVLDEAGDVAAPGEIGRLAVKGPTGCRYLDDPRQRDYVEAGWNITGDACSISPDGYIAYHTRYDDMIISAGYNISGLEVENALLQHPAVAEAAVVGAPDSERGQIVVAYVVPAGDAGDEVLARQLQDHVKQVLAPYKYPRQVRFSDGLPRNESGKIQRFRLRG